MVRISEILNQHGFRCIAPNNPAELPVANSNGDHRPVYKPFENPQPKSEQIEVQEGSASNPQIFRHFVDGSTRITGAGHIIDTKQRYLPMFVAQIGVAVTKLDSTRLTLDSYHAKSVFFLPGTFADEDMEKAQSLVREAGKSSRTPLTLELECYPVDDNEDEPVDSARKKILSTMQKMEIKAIETLAQNNSITRDSLLMIDGSLQFYGNLERMRESFRNVVGVAKSFDQHKRMGKGRNAKQVGTLVANLKHKHRTVAYKITHRNLTIGMWYLRLHSAKNINGAGIDNGVIKIEVFPDDPTGPEPNLDRSRCDLISREILSLRHPTTPSTDARWASHLYPIHMTERYIKTRFQNNNTIRACL